MGFVISLYENPNSPYATYYFITNLETKDSYIVRQLTDWEMHDFQRYTLDLINLNDENFIYKFPLVIYEDNTYWYMDGITVFDHDDFVEVNFQFYQGGKEMHRSKKYSHSSLPIKDMN